MSTIKTGTTLTTAYQVEGDTTGALVIQTGASPTTAMTIDTSQQVGVGVTPNAWAGGNTALQMAGPSMWGASGVSHWSTNTYFDGTNYKYIASNYVADYYQLNGAHVWRTAASGTAGANVSALNESMRIDSSGNVGIGTSSPSYKLVVSNAGANGIEFDVTGSTSRVEAIAYNRSTSAKSTLRLNALDYQFYAGSTSAERMRIDSSGNVGIGTSSPASKLNISGAGPVTFRINDTNTNNWDITNNSYLSFTRGSTEVMRIDSSGNLLVGTTNNYGQLTVGGFCAINNQQGVGGYASTLVTNCNGGSYYGIMIKNSSALNSNAMVFLNSSNSPNGAIAVTTTTTVYSTSSDYRLKDNVLPMAGALSKVLQLKPCTYTWKSTGEASQGFIAHELAEVVPNAVTGEKDEVHEDGSIKPQGIDTSFLVATLTAAIQELNAKVNAQAAEIAALKGQ